MAPLTPKYLYLSCLPISAEWHFVIFWNEQCSGTATLYLQDTTKKISIGSRITSFYVDVHQLPKDTINRLKLDCKLSDDSQHQQWYLRLTTEENLQIIYTNSSSSATIRKVDVIWRHYDEEAYKRQIQNEQMYVRNSMAL